MPDLVERFFTEGLTDEEEQVLSESLGASDEIAEKFAGLAEAAYVRYGFPEPSGPGAPPPEAPGPAPWGLWMGLALLLGAAGVFLALRPFQISVASVGTRLDQGVDPIPSKPNRDTGAPDPGVSGKSEKIRESEKDLGALGAISDGAISPPRSSEHPVGARVPSEAEVNSPALPRTEAARGPINLDQDPKAHYSGVSVQVHLTHPGPLQVKVFDTRGVEVTPLYSGSLGTGHWVFEWDGRLANGELAAPGFYQIEVRVGSFSQRKSIQIR